MSKNKENLWKEARESYQNLSEEIKKKSANIILNVIKTFWRSKTKAFNYRRNYHLAHKKVTSVSLSEICFDNPKTITKNTLNFLIGYCGNNLFFLVMLSEDIFWILFFNCPRIVHFPLFWNRFKTSGKFTRATWNSRQVPSFRPVMQSTMCFASLFLMPPSNKRRTLKLRN